MSCVIHDSSFTVREGDVLSSASSKYVVECFLGEGSFGKADKRQLVSFMGCFFDGPLICLEYELLDRSLYNVTQASPHGYLPLPTIRYIMEQLAQALLFLTEAGIIHMDLKPENIMVRGQEVKVIDFGSACNAAHCNLAEYHQSLPYRAPEVMLGLPATCSADMWSLGCILAELVQGSMLYPGVKEYHIWQSILKTHEALFQSTEEYGEAGKPHPSASSSLDNVVKVGNVSDDPRAASITDLMKRMLQLDPNLRISPREMLNHPFIYQDRPAQLVQPKNRCPKPRVDSSDTDC
ncbi:hypothetical protein NHX12_025159 [Muraenolepis orangiensis]|uniref:Protein kinase domain-containing protein n=1 Tax=Muraenolepis orangiensis TaxID=630683 RepID=A0A9Q0IRC5_9TELE|nr:hypothetical protein NHX12_025159 [Muraenolepis orangiensis]